MYKLTVWTDFGVASSDFFVTVEAAHAKGKYAVEKLGCARYTVRMERPVNWLPDNRLTVRNYKR